MSDYTLSEIAEIVDCEHKTAPKDDFGEYRSIRTTDIFNGKLDIFNANRVSEETYYEWTKRAIPESGDIILAREAPVGEVGWIKEGYKVCLGQRTVLLKVTNSEISKRFLLYYLVNPETRYDFQSHSTGSVVAHLNVKDIRNFKLSVPSLPRQKAIAAVLSSLDDKIDLLHRQNKTLEAMAETLFRQWFIEEAKENWDECCLGHLASFHNGKQRPNEVLTGNIPIYGGNGILGFSDIFNYQGVTIIIGRVGAYCGSLYIEYKPIWISDNALVAKPLNNKYSSFLYFLLKNLKLNEMAEGSSHPLLTQTLLKSIPIILPNSDLIDSFVIQADSWLKKVNFNKKQIHTLENLRNTLLPKLMSGKVRVAV